MPDVLRHWNRIPLSLVRSETWLAILLCCCLAGEARSQPANGPAFPAEMGLIPPRRTENTWYRIDVDPGLIRKFNTASLLVQEDRVLDAATAVQSLLEHPEDYLLNDDSQPETTRQYIHRWVEQLPRTVLQAYETQYGPKAQFLLDQYRSTGEIEMLREASRLYLHTVAGSQAAYLLASHHLDQGRYLPCWSLLKPLAEIRRYRPRFEPAITLKQAVCLSQLGQPAAARELLQTFLVNQNTSTLPLGGVPVDLQATLDRLQQLAERAGGEALAGEADNDWLLFRRTADRIRVSRQASPLPRPEWSVNVIPALLPEDLPRAEMVTQLIAQLEAGVLHEQFHRERSIVLPAWNPLVVNDHIVLTGFGAVAAFSRDTGQLQWKSASHDQSLAYLQNENLIERYRVHGVGEIGELYQYLLQEMYADLGSGTLSSDGRRIFAIRDSGLVNSPTLSRVMQNNDVVPVIPRESNILTALAAGSGKLLWEIGGTQGGQAPELAGHYFMGAPITAEGELHVLSENGGELFLTRLDPASGQPQWIQPLAHPRAGIMLDRGRRIAGTHLAYAAPLLVCQLNSGIAFGFDLSRQEFRWLYRYAETEEPIDDRLPFRNRGMNTSSAALTVSLTDGSRWQEAVPVIAGTRVLLTPSDTQDLLCLDLLSGQLLWSEPRRDGLYIEAVADDAVLIVGKGSLRCLNLQDGTEIWNTPLTPAVPAGRGLLQESVYHLPTTAAGLLSYSMATGHLLAGTELPDRSALGNLFAAGDQMYSARPGQLIAFEADNALSARLAAADENNPDPEQLLLQGQRALHRGDLRSGIAFLQQAYRSGQSAEVAIQLTKTLLSADTSQIELSREEVAELGDMMLRARHSTDMIFRYVQALLRMGREVDAYRVLEQIILSPDHESEVVAVTGTRLVRSDRLVAGMVRNLYDRARPDVQQQLRSLAENLLQSAVTAQQVLVRLPLMPTPELELLARLKYVRTETESARALEQERHLHWLSERGGPGLQAEICARLASLYVQAKKVEAAQFQIRRLESEFAQSESLPGQSGAQLARDLRQRLAASTPPRGPGPVAPETTFTVSVDPDRVTGARGDQPRPVLASHPADSPLADWSFDILRTNSELTAYDAAGQLQWRADLGDELPGAGDCRVLSEGQLVIFTCDGSLFGIDTFATTRQSSAPLEPLWQVELSPPARHEQTGFGFVENDGVGTIGPSPLMISWERQVGQIARCLDRALVYREDRAVIVRDAVDGSLLWKSEVTSTPQFVVWADQDEVTILDLLNQQGERLRLIDGQPLGKIELPPHDRLLALVEQRALFWRRISPEEGQLFTYDLRAGQIQWNAAVTGSISVADASDGLLLVYDIARKLVRVLDPRLPAPVLAEMPAPETKGRQLFVVADDQHWYVHFTSRPEAITQPLAFYSLQDINGELLAINRQTLQPAWTRSLALFRWIPRQPVASPFLVYGSVVPLASRAEQGEQVLKDDWKLEILDKRNGKTLAQFDDRLAGRLINMDSQPELGLYRFHFSEGTLQLQASPPPSTP